MHRIASIPDRADMPAMPEEPVGRNQVDTYEQIAERVRQVHEVLAERNVRVRQGSSLSQFLRQAEVLDRDWSAGKASDISVLCTAAHVNRTVQALLTLRDDPAVRDPLRRMASNVMMPDDRRQSRGKDALWEILLLAHLRQVGVKARFEDPPDIVATLDDSDYPIACKKVWTENGVKGHIRKAGQQLRRFDNGGVIALNLDDLLLPGRLLRHDDRESAGEFLDRFNLEFIDRHRDVLQKAVKAGQCDGVWVSVCTTTDLVGEDTPFNLFTQSTIWHLVEASETSKARLRRFAQAAGGGYLRYGP